MPTRDPSKNAEEGKNELNSKEQKDVGPSKSTENEIKKETSGRKKKEEEKKEEMSEEDMRIKNEVDLCVTRLSDASTDVINVALDTLSSMLRSTSGSSVTSIPRPLKYLRTHATVLKSIVSNLSHTEHQRKLCDILSLVSMMFESSDSNSSTEALNWKLKGNREDLVSWGHEFIRHLSGEIASLWALRVEAGESCEELIPMLRAIVTFEMTHHGEPHACDLLIEVGLAEHIVDQCDTSTFERVCQYLLSVASYLPYPEDEAMRSIAGRIFEKFEAWVDAFRVALRLGSRQDCLRLIRTCPEAHVKAQMALLCGHHKFFIQTDDEELDALIGNAHRSTLYMHAGKELDNLKPKSSEDIVKSHLMEQRTHLGISTVPMHVKNLATVFVSAFGNAGFSSDKLTADPKDTKWFTDVKEDRAMTALASLGILYLWNHEEGLNVIDKYFSSDRPYMKAGASLAIGIMFSGIRNSFEPAFSMLSESISPATPDKSTRLTSILGLGLSYAGTQHADTADALALLIADEGEDVEVQSMAALAMGLLFVSSCHESSETLAMCIMEKTAEQLTSTPLIRFLILGLSLYFLGKQEAAEGIIEMSLSFHPSIRSFAELTFTSVAYAGTGNVMQVQRFLGVVASVTEELKEKEKNASENSGSNQTANSLGNTANTNSTQGTGLPASDEASNSASDGIHGGSPVQAGGSTGGGALDHSVVAIMGLGLLAMGEEIGQDMLRRNLDNILQYGSVVSRRAIPLAHALTYVSNPQLPILEALSKLSHDQDKPTAQNAILAIGLVAAGTNNARAATMLRNLASFYAKDAECLFLTHVSLGLVFLGRGHLTLSPFHSDRFLLSPVALAALLVVLHTGFDAKSLIFGTCPYMLFALSPAISPRITTTVDMKLQPISMQVRVGKAIDTVAMAGKPKRITGFQTHTTPVVLQHEDRVEVPKGEKYRALCNVVEGVVIVEQVPEEDTETD